MFEQIHKNAILEENLNPSSELENNLENTNLEDFNNLAEDENHNSLKLEDSSLESLDLSNNETTMAQNEDNQANCLALTVRKDYNITIIKNIFTTSGRMSLKIALSTLVLNFLRMFF